MTNHYIVECKDVAQACEVAAIARTITGHEGVGIPQYRYVRIDEDGGKWGCASKEAYQEQPIFRLPVIPAEEFLAGHSPKGDGEGEAEELKHLQLSVRDRKTNTNYRPGYIGDLTIEEHAARVAYCKGQVELELERRRTYNMIGKLHNAWPPIEGEDNG